MSLLADASIATLLELIEAGRAAEEELEARVSSAVPLSNLSAADSPSDEEIASVVDAVFLCVEGVRGQCVNGNGRA